MLIFTEMEAFINMKFETITWYKWIIKEGMFQWKFFTLPLVQFFKYIYFVEVPLLGHKHKQSK